MDRADLSERGIAGAGAEAALGPRTAIDLRLSVPWFGGRYFATLVAGPERRRPARRASERVVHPLGTTGNLLFVSGIAMVVLSVVTVIVAVYSSVLLS